MPRSIMSAIVGAICLIASCAHTAADDSCFGPFCFGYWPAAHSEPQTTTHPAASSYMQQAPTTAAAPEHVPQPKKTHKHKRHHHHHRHHAAPQPHPTLGEKAPPSNGFFPPLPRPTPFPQEQPR